MEMSEVFNLQDHAARSNIQIFPDKFRWCHHAIELMIDTHVFLANDPDMIAYRTEKRDTDSAAFEAMNVVVNLAYDAVGSLISASRLIGYGVLADAWSIIRGAFESTCYAEFFILNSSKVKDYMSVAEAIKQNYAANVTRDLHKVGLAINQVRESLEKHDKKDRTQFYSRLCNFGTHASPMRVGSRIKINEPEVRAYLSIGHRGLIQCLADFAATAKYTMGIPFDAWPGLMAKEASLGVRCKSLEQEYGAIFVS